MHRTKEKMLVVWERYEIHKRNTTISFKQTFSTRACTVLDSHIIVWKKNRQLKKLSTQKLEERKKTKTYF